MQRFGMTLLVAGAAVLAGYAAYEIVRALFTDEIPLVVSIAVVVVAAGFLLLLAGIGYERWRAHQEEDLDEVEP
ncbi:MAG: hypothetical protein HQ548_02290 [Chloroflexi bacterium]|nr:hypothetical protein [Chloroflexota bacterium]